MKPSSLRLALVLTLSALPAVPAFAQTSFPETEPNNTKAAANAITLLASGDSITGTSTGTSTTTPGLGSADYFLVTIPTAAPGIYQNIFALTSGFTGTIRGLTQSNGTFNGTSDAAFQTTTTGTGNLNKFYTFGGSSQLYYHVTGTASTTGSYVSSFTQTTITPTFVGTVPVGPITFTNTQLGSALDSEIFIYDGNFSPVPGFLNDDYDEPPTLPNSTSGNSLLTRTFAPGTYYFALSNYNTANNQPSPVDDDFRNGSVVDFPGVLANSSTAVFTNSPMSIVSTGGTLSFSATKSAAFDVFWGSFTVGAVPEPAHYGGAAALAALALAALRRRRQK